MFSMNKKSIPNHLLKYFESKRTYKPKDDAMIPHRVFDALMADGWYGRSDIIWAKGNPMPESVTDRPTKAHEYIFLLSKSKQYYYDADAIREPHKRDWSGSHGPNNSKVTNVIGGQESHKGIMKAKPNTAGHNKRSVWNVNTKPFPEAHFAVFPEKLIEPCILAGSSHKACEICGAPWERVVEIKEKGSYEYRNYAEQVNKPNQRGGGYIPDRKSTTGWQPTCKCENEGTGKSTVLDPFIGSGTTAKVAVANNRDWIGIELNPEYAEMIKRRIRTKRKLMF